MKIFEYGAEAGHAITRFDSRAAKIARVAQAAGGTSVHYLNVGAQGIVGYHQALSPQLFLVVSGAGWVRGEDSLRRPVTAGQGVFWEQGEGHESGSDTGMAAIVIEGEGLSPSIRETT
jgi:hypothetical protein